MSGFIHMLKGCSPFVAQFTYNVNDRVGTAALVSNLHLGVRRLFGSGAYSVAALIRQRR